MKKLISSLIILSLLCAVFVMPSNAAVGTDIVNEEVTVSYVEVAPSVDGVVSLNEYGSVFSVHSFSNEFYQFTDDGEHNLKKYINDIKFYMCWSEDAIHLAWEVETNVHTPFPKGTYEMVYGSYYAEKISNEWPSTEQGQATQLKQMWMFSCVQFIITPGAPSAKSTSFQDDKNFLSVGFCQMNDGKVGKAVWNTPLGTSPSDFNYSYWDAAVSRNNAWGKTTYEVAIPFEMCGISELKNGVEIGLGYSVSAQKHYYKDGASMVEWQDTLLGWPVKADNAGVIELTGKDEYMDSPELPEGDLYQVVDETADQNSLVYTDGLDSVVQDGGASVITYMDREYNLTGNSVYAVLLAPNYDYCGYAEGSQYFTVVGKGTTSDSVAEFYDEDMNHVATDSFDNCIIVAVDHGNPGYNAIQNYSCGDIVGVWGFEFNEYNTPIQRIYSNSVVYLADYQVPADDDYNSDVSNDNSGDVSEDNNGDVSNGGDIPNNAVSSPDHGAPENENNGTKDDGSEVSHEGNNINSASEKAVPGVGFWAIVISVITVIIIGALALAVPVAVIVIIVIVIKKKKKNKKKK